MPWLKLLHLSAVIVWCGALLYLPLATAAAASQRRPVALGSASDEVLRSLFNWVATPAALVAIMSGTAIFVLHGPMAPWLLTKLGLVGLLVLGHAVYGMLILRAERRHTRAVPALAMAVGALLLPLLLAIAWLVLRKPAWAVAA